jgi:ornithine cyclodeaminase/alanine dehydrogenase-like protein (mu-crystallin family)
MDGTTLTRQRTGAAAAHVVYEHAKADDEGTGFSLVDDEVR